jgi:hypothetical protein
MRLTNATSLTAARERFLLNVKSYGWAAAAEAWALGEQPTRLRI